MRKLLLLLLAACLVAPTYGQQRKTYKKKQNRTSQTQKKSTVSHANNAVGGIGCALETYRLEHGTYGYWISFIQQYAPNVGQAKTFSAALLEVKKEIRLLDEGNIEAGKRFIAHLVKVYGITSALNQLFDLWQFTTPEWNWIEKTARAYASQYEQQTQEE